MSIFKRADNLLPALRKMFPILKVDGNNYGISEVLRGFYGFGSGHGEMKVADRGDERSPQMKNGNFHWKPPGHFSHT